MRTLVLATLLLGVACKKPPAVEEPVPKPEPVRVGAASDLTEAFGELKGIFEKQSGLKVELSFSSSGLLAKQIAQGGPYDVFAAASTTYVDEAIKSGACDEETKRVYATGQLVAWSKDGVLAKLEDLAAPRIKHIAIANPEHAPYGIAAKEVLVGAGLWEPLKDRIVFGDNVRATLQMAETGNAEVALVAASLLIGKPVLAIDAVKHKPISQTLVVCSNGGNVEGGKAFVDLVTSEAGRAVLKKYGFSAP